MAISINKKTSSISGAVRIPSTAQIRGVEAAWIEACHPHWGVVLMEQAGMAAARVVRDLYFELATDKKVVIVCITSK